MMEPDIRCEWRNVTGHACAAQATASVRFAGPGSRLAALCDEHASRWSGALRDRNHPVRIEPICRDPRPVALLCGAIAGAIPPDVRDVIADYIAHDRLGQADPSPLLDLAEQRGLHEGGYGPERYEEWAERDAHGTGDNPHVWLPVPNGVHYWTQVHESGPVPRATPARQCPCGVYDHETGQDGLPICTGCQSTIDPEVCHCGYPCSEHGGWGGHAPVPMGCVCHLEADPDDVADLLDERAAMDDVARDAARQRRGPVRQ